MTPALLLHALTVDDNIANACMHQMYNTWRSVLVSQGSKCCAGHIQQLKGARPLLLVVAVRAPHPQDCSLFAPCAESHGQKVLKVTEQLLAPPYVHKRSEDEQHAQHGAPDHKPVVSS